jgi:hypothetical protein
MKSSESIEKKKKRGGKNVDDRKRKGHWHIMVN